MVLWQSTGSVLGACSVPRLPRRTVSLCRAVLRAASSRASTLRRWGARVGCAEPLALRRAATRTSSPCLGSGARAATTAPWHQGRLLVLRRRSGRADRRRWVIRCGQACSFLAVNPSRLWPRWWYPLVSVACCLWCHGWLALKSLYDPDLLVLLLLFVCRFYESAHTIKCSTFSHLDLLSPSSPHV